MSNHDLYREAQQDGAPTDAEHAAAMQADWESDQVMEMELEAQEQQVAHAPAPCTRRPLTEWEQEERWRHEDEAERMADFMREDY